MLDVHKIVMMINWFARQTHGKSVDKLELLKLVYMADRFHLRRYGRLISGDNYYAMQLGPVPSITKMICDDRDSLTAEQRRVADEYLSVDGNNVHSKKASRENHFSESELNALQGARLKAMLVKDTGESLPDFTHHFPEWKDKQRYLTTPNATRPIDPVDFFKELPTEDKKYEYCPASSRLLKSNREKFIERRALENLIGAAQ